MSRKRRERSCSTSRIAAGHRKLRGSRAFLSPGCPNFSSLRKFARRFRGGCRVYRAGGGHSGGGGSRRPGGRGGRHGYPGAGVGVGHHRDVGGGIRRYRWPTRDPQGRLRTFCHAVPGRWHVMGVTQAAGLSLRWLRDTIAPGVDYDTLTAAAAQVPAGAMGCCGRRTCWASGLRISTPRHGRRSWG